MKNKLVLFGLLTATLLLFSCKNNTEPDNVPQGYTVTVDFGEYGLSASGEKITTIQVTKDNPYLSDFEPIIKSEYENKVEFYLYYYKENGNGIELLPNKVISSNLTIYAVYRAKSVQNLSVTKENDSTIKLEWDVIPDASYEVISVPSKGVSQTNYVTTNEYSQTIAEDETGYSFTVTAVLDDDNLYPSKSVSKAINIGIKNSEWLMLMYMDGDNNLNDPIYFDLNEAEAGLSELSKSDSNASVTIVALWDGWNFESNNKDEETSFADLAPDSISIETASTRLLELGADSRDYTTWGGIQLSDNTKDLTDTVDWIENGEVNMADKTTLENFLKWAKDNYSADKVILQFSNHGGGPRSVTNGKVYGRRSMCWDDTSDGTGFLKTSDVSAALAAAGYGTDNKLSLIMEDVCLGGSLEEAYELKDYADYYVGSPNNVPGNGFDYISFVKSLKKDATVEHVGCNLIKSYRSDYEWTSADWSKYLQKNPDLSGTGDMWISISNPNLSTLSFIDLSKVNAVKEAVSDLAQLIYDDNQPDERIVTDTYNLYFLNDDGKYYDNNGNTPAVGATLYYMPRKFGIKWWTAYYGDPIYYEGTFGCLKDLGTMCVFMREYYSESDWPELNAKANAVTSALSNAVVASWRDGYNAPSYYKNKTENVYQDVLGSTADLGAGLTINCSCWVQYTGADGKNYSAQGFANWYKNELAFGKDCSAWTNLIDYWWGTSN